MAKIKNNTSDKEVPVNEENTGAAQKVEETVERKPLSIFDFKLQAAIVAILAFVFYVNTYSNEFAHDDGIVIVKNEYVMEGFAGLKSIFTKDAYDSYYRQLNTVNQLAGGRYRPLSIASFAVEQQLFGPVPEEKIDSFLKQSLSYGIRGPAEKKLVSDMHVRHIMNVFWYMLSVVVLLYFLRYIIFKKDPLIAFIAALIFTIHPIHTEVVANVKSRDEIMSLLFMCLTFICAFKYEENKKKEYFIGGLVSYFLAFLSKEYAITVLGILPLSFYLFNNYSLPKALRTSMPYFLVFGLYIFIRLSVATIGDDTMYDTIHNFMTPNTESEKEVLNNPYYYASHTQKIATEISTSLRYLKLLVFPHPLSADYSFNSIPYQDFGDWQVWLSILVHLALVFATIFFIINRNKYKIFAFAFAFYLLHLFMVNNFVFNIGATMGERLIFHSSVGFAIVLAMLLYKGAQKVLTPATAQTGIFAVLGIVTVLSGFKTITRNKDWKNDKTLFMQDINVVPSSVLVNGNVAASYISMADYENDEAIKNGYLHKAISLLDNAIAVHPGFVAGFLNQGIAYYKLGILDSAEKCLDSVEANYPNYPSIKTLRPLLAESHMKNGWVKYGKVGKYPEAIAEFNKGIKIDSGNVELWYNLGGAYFSNRQPVEAINAWNRALRLKHDHQQAMMGKLAAISMLKNMGADPVTLDRIANSTEKLILNNTAANNTKK